MIQCLIALANGLLLRVRISQSGLIIKPVSCDHPKVWCSRVINLFVLMRLLFAHCCSIVYCTLLFYCILHMVVLLYIAHCCSIVYCTLLYLSFERISPSTCPQTPKRLHCVTFHVTLAGRSQKYWEFFVKRQDCHASFRTQANDDIVSFDASFTLLNYGVLCYNSCLSTSLA